MWIVWPKQQGMSLLCLCFALDNKIISVMGLEALFMRLQKPTWHFKSWHGFRRKAPNMSGTCESRNKWCRIGLGGVRRGIGPRHRKEPKSSLLGSSISSGASGDGIWGAVVCYLAWNFFFFLHLMFLIRLGRWWLLGSLPSGDVAAVFLWDFRRESSSWDWLCFCGEFKVRICSRFACLKFYG